MIITRSIKEPTYEAATEVTQPPQNLIVNPTKMSAIEAAPRYDWKEGFIFGF